MYRHFPDADALFRACSAHWASLNPPPDPGTWQHIDDPDERLRHALTELYAWYARGEPMLTNIFRDAPLVPAMARASAGFERGFESLQAELMRGRKLTGRPRARVAAALGHALEFGTWRSLTREHGLEDRGAIELMVRLVAAAGRS